jgi:hypothetical protein
MKKVLVAAMMLGTVLAGSAAHAGNGFVRLINFDPRDGQWHAARLFDTAQECNNARIDLQNMLAIARVTPGKGPGDFSKYFNCVPE